MNKQFNSATCSSNTNMGADTMKMRASSVPWLGNVPEHWRVLSIRRICQVKRGASPRPIESPQYFDHDGEYAWVRISDVSASNKYLIATTQRLSKTGKEKSVPLEPGALFLSIAGSVGKPIITKIKCCIHDGFVYFLGLKESADFLYYLFCTGELFKGLGKLGTQLNLNTDTISNIKIPIPPLTEQRRIANFLDRETDKIDRLIAEKEKLVGQLEEKRLAMTNTALQMSETQLMRFGLVAERMNRAVHVVDEDEYTPVGLYNYGRGMFHKMATRGRELGDSSFFYIEADDLVLSGQFAWEGAVALARKEDAGCVASHRYPIFTARPNMAHPGYLFSFFRTDTGHMLLNHHSRGAAGRNRPLNDRTLAKEKIPVPPMPIQKQIGEMLEQEIRLREEVERSNAFLLERRAALISAAVTGRLDVREVVS